MLRKYISYISAGIVFIAAGFLTGYFIGTMLCGEKSNAAVSEGNGIVYNNYTSVTTPQIKTPQGVNYDIYYMLKINDDKLCIYEISGETSRLVREFKTNINLYPEIDREELSEGIIKESLDEALETAENFTG